MFSGGVLISLQEIVRILSIIADLNSFLTEVKNDQCFIQGRLS